MRRYSLLIGFVILNVQRLCNNHYGKPGMKNNEVGIFLKASAPRIVLVVQGLEIIILYTR